MAAERSRAQLRSFESWGPPGDPDFREAQRYYGAASPSEIMEAQQLTADERRVKALFYQQFRFSQGSPETHNLITRWLNAGGYFQNLQIPEITPAYIDKLTPPQMHKQMDEDVRAVDTRMAWSHLHWIVNNPETKTQDELASEILDGILDRDLKYQEEGRPGRLYSESEQQDPRTDPFMSFVKTFVHDGTPVRTDAFDALNTSMRRVLLSEAAAAMDPDREEPLTPRQENILALAEQWEFNHMGESFFTPAEEEIDVYVRYGLADAKPQAPAQRYMEVLEIEE